MVYFSIENDTIKTSEKLHFSFEISSGRRNDQNLMVDYAIYFQKANGTLAPKVFKLSKKTIEVGDIIHVNKSHSFKKINTRKYYHGKHVLEILINGQIKGTKNFNLVL